jgi:hypothetical protein
VELGLNRRYIRVTIRSRRDFRAYLIKRNSTLEARVESKKGIFGGFYTTTYGEEEVP